MVIKGKVTKLWAESIPQVVGGLSFDSGRNYTAVVQIEIFIEQSGQSTKNFVVKGESSKASRHQSSREHPEQQVIAEALQQATSQIPPLL
jgi:hypothetical protein